MKFQILWKDLGFEEIPGTDTWVLGGSSVSAVGGWKAEKVAIGRVIE